MEINILTSTGSQIYLPICSSSATLDQRKGKIVYRGNGGFGFRRNGCTARLHAFSPNGVVSPFASLGTESSSTGDVHRKRSSLESLFCYDKPIPEEIIEKPVGVSLAEKAIGSNPRCSDCQAKGAVLCATCSGSGLYVDSIMESQGIIVKVRCLGCGGTGNIMCSECGGRGHLGRK